MVQRLVRPNRPARPSPAAVTPERRGISCDMPAVEHTRPRPFLCTLLFFAHYPENVTPTPHVTYIYRVQPVSSARTTASHHPASACGPLDFDLGGNGNVVSTTLSSSGDWPWRQGHHHAPSHHASHPHECSRRVNRAGRLHFIQYSHRVTRVTPRTNSRSHRQATNGVVPLRGMAHLDLSPATRRQLLLFSGVERLAHSVCRATDAVKHLRGDLMLCVQLARRVHCSLGRVAHLS